MSSLSGVLTTTNWKSSVPFPGITILRNAGDGVPTGGEHRWTSR